MIFKSLSTALYTCSKVKFFGVIIFASLVLLERVLFFVPFPRFTGDFEGDLGDLLGDFFPEVAVILGALGISISLLVD